MQIVFQAHCMDATGYSHAVRGLAIGLDEIGANVKIVNIDMGLPDPKLPPDRRERLVHLMDKPLDPQRVTVIHRAANSFEKLAEPTIGSTYWETDKIPDIWRETCNRMDMIFVASQHNADVLKRCGVTVPVAHIRPGIFAEDFRTDDSPSARSDPQPTPFTFLSVFQWNFRKGYDILFRSFLEEFRQEDDVRLVIKTSSMNERWMPTSYIRNWIDYYRATYGNANSAPMDVHTEIVSCRDIVRLYQTSDAFVLPSRGEGIGLPYLEAAAAGLPVLATRWGGQMDFLSDDNSFLVGYELAPVTPQWFTPFYTTDQRWAEPSVHDVRRQMRTIHAARADAQRRAGLLQHKILSGYTWRHAAQDIAQAVQKLTGKSVV